MSNIDYFDTDDRQTLLGWFNGTVLDSYWSTDRVETKGKANYDGSDETKLFWLVQIDEVLQEYDKVVAPSLSLNMGLGKGWYPNEDGTRVEHEDAAPDEEVEAGNAKPIVFKGGSMYGKFLGLVNGKYESYYTGTPVDPMVEEPKVLDDGPEPMYQLWEARADLAKHGLGDPRDASIWRGTRWEFRGLGFMYRQTKVPGFKAVPVTYLGYTDPSQLNQEGAGEPVSGGRDVDPQEVSLTLPAGTEPALVERLTKTLSASSSHTEFMKEALKLEEVKTNPEVKSAVMNAENGPWGLK